MAATESRKTDIERFDVSKLFSYANRVKYVEEYVFIYNIFLKLLKPWALFALIQPAGLKHLSMYNQLDISWYNITWYWTQHDKFEDKTSVRQRTH